MAYNTRRGGEAINTVGARRNPPLGNNFIPGGQLAPPNRPHIRPHGPPQANGNFRPQHQRMPGSLMQQQPRPQGPPPQQIRPQGPPLKMPQQHQPPQQAPPIQNTPLPMKPDPNESFSQDEIMSEEPMTKRAPFWATRAGKISRKERQRRRNVRLSKILQPKNAVMILNELVKSATYTVTDMPQPSEMNQYTATVLVDGVSHVGHGRSKMEAKSLAAENALKYIVKNRQFSALKKDEDGDVKMDIGEDGTPTLPWQHVASFALYKLLHSWGEDPNQTRGIENAAQQPPQNRPAKKMPENAAHMNPLMLLNQMLPQAQFEELAKTGSPPNVVFTFKCTVENESFTGTGPNKKSAKKMAAFAVCHKILGIQYPPEIYLPAN